MRDHHSKQQHPQPAYLVVAATFLAFKQRLLLEEQLTVLAKSSWQSSPQQITWMRTECTVYTVWSNHATPLGVGAWLGQRALSLSPFPHRCDDRRRRRCGGGTRQVRQIYLYFFLLNLKQRNNHHCQEFVYLPHEIVVACATTLLYVTGWWLLRQRNRIWILIRKHQEKVQQLVWRSRATRRYSRAQ